MKNCYLVKLVSAFCMVLCLQAQGQTYFNFAMGYTPPLPNTSHSIVRTVDAQRAVAYYEEGGTPKLAVIDMYGHIAETKLSSVIEIKDIRIVGDDIFFCGQNTNNRRGIVGHTSVSAMENCSLTSIPYQELDMNIGSTNTTLWRMAAYSDVAGRQKVVAIGEMYYISSSSGLPPWFDPCTSAYYNTCHTFFVTEFDYIGGFSLVGCKFLCDTSRYERADDVVVTDNWLGVVSYYPSQNELIIHRCNKSSVITSFDNYYSYTVPSLAGMYHCCRMRGDTIALVTKYETGLSPNYETHMRTVDLASMTMTSAQGYNLLDKSEPEEIVYLPECAKLVLLQHQKFPSTAYHYAFVNWEPYTVPPYTAVTVYENGDHPFHSIDQLTNKYIVAVGGNYWIEMDAPNHTPASSCYMLAFQRVFQLGVPSYNTGNHVYKTQYTFLTPKYTFEGCSEMFFNLGCRFN